MAQDWISSLQDRAIYQAKWMRDHTVMVSIKLNKNTDQDIIDWLGRQPSRQGAIKQLIRAAIKGGSI